MAKIICGIQQMGIGVPNVEAIWKWYRKNFGIDIKVFEDAAHATRSDASDDNLSQRQRDRQPRWLH